MKSLLYPIEARFRSLRVICLGLLLLMSCEERIEPTQFGYVVGAVKDLQTGNIVADATISSNLLPSTLDTDDQGSFNLGNIEVGDYSMTIRAVGYRTTAQNFKVLANDTTRLEIFLEPMPQTNEPPFEPFNPYPEPGTDTLNRSLTLSWQANDQDEGDSLTFDLFFFRPDNPAGEQLLSASKDTSYEISGLDFETVYFWQVVVRDAFGEERTSDLWSFRTRPRPNHRLRFVREEQGQQVIYASELTGGDSLRLTSPIFSAWQPRMNPQRTEVAFVRRVGMESHLFVMDREGKSPRQITQIPLGGYFNAGIGYCWSPDGTELVYSRYDKLYRIDRDGGRLETLSTAPLGFHFRSCDWSGVNDQIVVEAVSANGHQVQLMLLDLVTSQLSQLLPNQPGAYSSPSFSIDGTKVLFCHDVSGFSSPTGRQLDAEIKLLELNSGDIANLSINKAAGTNDLEARFAPDGGSVIFTNYSNANLRVPQIMRVDLFGLDREILVENASMPDWQ